MKNSELCEASDQINLFTANDLCEHPCRCGLDCNCEGCTADTCIYPNGVDDSSESEADANVIDEMLDEMQRNEHEDDVRLALAHDSTRALIVNMLEVLATYDRIEDDDENIFIPRPTIDKVPAEELYNKLYAIHTLLEQVRQTR